MGPDGIWRAAIPPHPASLVAHILTFDQNDGNTTQLEDILFGDVYLCGGQSNMQFSTPMVWNASAEVAAAANYPSIRVMSIGQLTTSATPLTDLAAVNLSWSRASEVGVIGGPGNWTTFSAVCWLFGRDLFDAFAGTVPVGLVSNNWGGTNIQTWSSPDALSQCTPIPPPNDPSPALRNSSLWNANVAPFTTGPTAFAGALWYQGESNAPPFPAYRRGYYACAIRAMISDWRLKLDAGDRMWFGVVQLAPFLSSASYGYAEVRSEQCAALALPNVTISTAMDWGDALSPWGTYHPRFKQPVATRLAAAALAVRYHHPGGPAWIQPIVSGVRKLNSSSGTLSALVTFDSTTVQGGPLVIASNRNPCPTSDGVPACLCAEFTIVVAAPVGSPPLPTIFTRLNGTQLIDGTILDTGSYTFSAAEARCNEINECVGFQVLNGGAPGPGDNTTVSMYEFRSLAQLHNNTNATSWATFTPSGTRALPAVAIVGPDGVSLTVTTDCGYLCVTGKAELRAVTYAWSSWPVATLYAGNGSGMPALPFFVNVNSTAVE